MNHFRSDPLYGLHLLAQSPAGRIFGAGWSDVKHGRFLLFQTENYSLMDFGRMRMRTREPLGKF